MAGWNKQPVSIDGVRLDSHAFGVESLTGRWQLPAVRDQGVAVPGRHGELSSPNEDYGPLFVDMSMWVTTYDDDGRELLGPNGSPVNRKEAIRHNIGRIFMLAGTRSKYHTLRQYIGSDQSARTNYASNPRMDISSTNTVEVRRNRARNPSFEAAGVIGAARTNRLTNPSWKYSGTGWLATSVNTDYTGSTALAIQGIAGTTPVGRFVALDSGDGGSGTSVGIQAAANAASITFAGSPVSGSMILGTGYADAPIAVQVRMVFLDDVGTVLDTILSAPQDVQATPMFGTTRPDFSTTIYVSGNAPSGTANVWLVGETVGVVPAGVTMYAQKAIVEFSATPGTYFSGDSGTNYAWNGTAGASTSYLKATVVPYWAADTGSLVTNTADAAKSKTAGEWVSAGDTDAGLAILRQNPPSTINGAKAQWSGSVMVRSDERNPPELVLRIAAYNTSNALIGHGRVGSSTGRTRQVEFTPTKTWWRYEIEHAWLPAGTVKAGIEVTLGESVPDDTRVQFDAVMVEDDPTTSSYFDGSTDGTGQTYLWDGTANTTESKMMAGNVANWPAVGGTFTTTTTARPYPFRWLAGHGMYVVSDTPSPSGHYVRTLAAQPLASDLARSWTGGVFAYARSACSHAKVELLFQDAAGTTTIGRQSGPWVSCGGGWTWIKGPVARVPAGTQRVRMHVHIGASSRGGTPPPDARMALSSGVLTPGGGNLEYVDELSPGGRLTTSTSRPHRDAQYQQVIVKGADSVPATVEVQASGRYIARLPLRFKSAAEPFWTDPYPTTWTSPLVGSDNTALFEVYPLAGSTAPIEDGIYLLDGPCPSPMIVDPQTGWYFRYNGTLTSSQALLIDAGASRAGVGGKNLSPSSSLWRNVIDDCDWTSTRAAIYVMTPEWDGVIGGPVVRISARQCDRVRVTARRKFL